MHKFFSARTNSVHRHSSAPVSRSCERSYSLRHFPGGHCHLYHTCTKEPKERYDKWTVGQWVNLHYYIISGYYNYYAAVLCRCPQQCWRFKSKLSSTQPDSQPHLRWPTLWDYQRCRSSQVSETKTKTSHSPTTAPATVIIIILGQERAKVHR